MFKTFEEWEKSSEKNQTIDYGNTSCILNPTTLIEFVKHNLNFAGYMNAPVEELDYDTLVVARTYAVENVNELLEKDFSDCYFYSISKIHGKEFMVPEDKHPWTLDPEELAQYPYQIVERYQIRYGKQETVNKGNDDLVTKITAPAVFPVTYKYTSTKEYHDEFPCAYRQWRADSHCNLIHGYSFSMKFYFGTNDLDVRNWVADYGGLKELKQILKDQFDHTLLVAQDDPELETFKLLEQKNMAKLTILPRLGCEGLADMLYKYVNGVYIPDMWGPGEAERLWCYRVEVRETQSNMAYREGHREWKENLFDE